MRRNMRRLTGAALGSFGLLLTGGSLAAAQDQPTSQHDIPWYMANNAARSARINLCRSDHRFARDVDCLNAETAEDRLYAQRADRGGQPGQGQTRGGNLFDDLTSPTYWAANRLARISVLGACKHPPSVYTPDVCAAAQQGDALDAGRQRRP